MMQSPPGLRQRLSGDLARGNVAVGQSRRATRCVLLLDRFHLDWPSAEAHPKEQCGEPQATPKRRACKSYSAVRGSVRVTSP